MAEKKDSPNTPGWRLIEERKRRDKVLESPEQKGETARYIAKARERTNKKLKERMRRKAEQRDKKLLEHL